MIFKILAGSKKYLRDTNPVTTIFSAALGAKEMKTEVQKTAFKN